MPYVAVGLYSYSLKAENRSIESRIPPCFVKIIRKKNTNFGLALRKWVHRIIALVSSYNPSKINSKYFSSLNPYAFLFIILIYCCPVKLFWGYLC